MQRCYFQGGVFVDIIIESKPAQLVDRQPQLLWNFVMEKWEGEALDGGLIQVTIGPARQDLLLLVWRLACFYYRRIQSPSLETQEVFCALARAGLPFFLGEDCDHIRLLCNPRVVSQLAVVVPPVVIAILKEDGFVVVKDGEPLEEIAINDGCNPQWLSFEWNASALIGLDASQNHVVGCYFHGKF